MTTGFPLSLVCSSWADEMHANLYTGCEFGCTYCIPDGRRWAKRFGPMLDDLALLAKHMRVRTCDPLDLDRLMMVRAVKYSKLQPVSLSRYSDPYCALKETVGVTKRAIAELHRRGVGVRIITKGGMRACRDFQAPGADGQGRYAPALGAHPDDAFGATVTLVDEKDSAHWEPGAAPPAERMEGLRAAHNPSSSLLSASQSGSPSLGVRSFPAACQRRSDNSARSC